MPETRRAVSRNDRTPIADRVVGELSPQILGAAVPAHDVVAQMHGEVALGFEGQQRVEIGHAVGLGGRNGEPLTNVRHGSGADPADLVLDRLEGGQEKVAPPLGGTPSSGDPAVLGRADTALPSVLRRTENGIDGATFFQSGRGVDQPEIHFRPPLTSAPGRSSRSGSRSP